MTKSQNAKDEQQKDLCITSEQLTEQWKKGELPYAEYYIKLAGGEYTNDVWDIGGWQSFNKKGDVVDEVLAEVPSYEQWQAKLEENKKLKEILKKTKESVSYREARESSREMVARLHGQIKQINQVLGEE